MGFLGDKKASFEQLNRVVEVVLPCSAGEAGARVVAAAVSEANAQEKAPILGSKLFVKSVSDSSVTFGYGNKVNDFWLVLVELDTVSSDKTLVTAECVRCDKRGEVSRFLHQTLKPLLDAINNLS